MRTYRCKVKTIKYLEVVISAENKDEAKRKVPSFCAGGWRNAVASQTGILDIEHISKEK